MYCAGRANSFQKVGISGQVSGLGDCTRDAFSTGKPKRPGTSGACQRIGMVASGNPFSFPQTHITGLPTGKINIMAFNDVFVSC